MLLLKLRMEMYMKAFSTHFLLRFVLSLHLWSLSNPLVFCLQMDVVLKLAHIVDESTPAGEIPSKESLVDTIIFKFADVVHVEAKDVDPNYALKSADNFTDSAISNTKVNGQSMERELQPWDGEEGGEALEEGGSGGLEATASSAVGF
jgi:hypothetical protein